MTLTVYVIRADTECPFHNVDFARFHSCCIFSHSTNVIQEIFCAYSFTIYPAKEFVFFFFSQEKKFQELERFFDYIILRIFMHLLLMQ